MKVLKELARKALLFCSCGFIYYMIECLYRGYSHLSMFILAGLLSVFCIDTPNNIYSFDLDYRLQVLISSTLCTLGEGICGLIVNKWLGLHIWDYSHLKGTFFWGQCNIIFCCCWVLIVGLIGIFYCDAFNYYIFKIDPCPYYKINGKVFYQMKERRDSGMDGD